jgi:hypothetical protein
MFPLIGFVAQQILGIIKILIDFFISLVGKSTNLKKCCLQIENLKKLIFITKIGLVILE